MHDDVPSRENDGDHAYDDGLPNVHDDDDDDRDGDIHD